MPDVHDVVAHARTLTVTGAEGELRWGYARAALLRAWTAVRDEHGVWTLGAEIVELDDFRAAQQPLKFAVTGKPWRWPIVSLQIVGGSLSASLGLPER